MDTDGKILDKRAFPVPDESGKVKNVMEVARDITAKVRMEEEASRIQSQLVHANKMTSLGTLVSEVAHEISNPNSFIFHNARSLTKIWKDVVEILVQHYGSKEDFKLGSMSLSELKTLVPDLLNGINEGAVKINNFVENLRDFIRPEKTCMDGMVNVNTVIMTSRLILDNHIRKFTNNFYVKCADNMPPVRGSAQKIEQVVINIIMNALQALPDNESGIRVSTFHDKRSSNVVIKVQDEGTGISQDILDKVTEPFFTTRTDSGGTGLGLSISHTIVKEHKGSLSFKSRKGKGTTVYIKLPAVR